MAKNAEDARMECIKKAVTVVKMASSVASEKVKQQVNNVAVARQDVAAAVQQRSATATMATTAALMFT